MRETESILGEERTMMIRTAGCIAIPDALTTAEAVFWLGIDHLHSIQDHFMWTVDRHSQRNRELLKLGAQLLLICLHRLLALIERALLSDLSATGEPRDDREQHTNRQVWSQ